MEIVTEPDMRYDFIQMLELPETINRKVARRSRSICPCVTGHPPGDWCQRWKYGRGLKVRGSLPTCD